MLFKKKKKTVVQKAARHLIADVSPRSIITEQFRTLRTNLHFSLPEHELQTLFFTSASPSEGKSTVSANTAVVFAQEGKRVLFIDADMRKPTVHYTFQQPNAAGLSTLLTGQATLEDVERVTDIPNLTVITSGPLPPNPSELLGSQIMKEKLEEIKKHYDYIVFDAPPALSVTDAQVLSSLVDGTILVANAGSTEKDALIKAKEMLEASQAKLLGVVLNNYSNADDYYYYQYYGEN